jgi:hypothetical protein
MIVYGGLTTNFDLASDMLSLSLSGVTAASLVPAADDPSLSYARPNFSLIQLLFALGMAAACICVFFSVVSYYIFYSTFWRVTCPRCCDCFYECSTSLQCHYNAVTAALRVLVCVWLTKCAVSERSWYCQLTAAVVYSLLITCVSICFVLY